MCILQNRDKKEHVHFDINATNRLFSQHIPQCTANKKEKKLLVAVQWWWWWRIGDGGDLMVMRWKGGGYKETSSCSRQMAWDDPNSCVILSLIGIFPLSCNRFHFHHFQCIYCCFIVVLIRTWWWYWWCEWVSKRESCGSSSFHNITTMYSPLIL